MIHLPQKCRCSKCGTIRPVELECCPECGAKRSRRLKSQIVSFWKLPEADRREIARGMYDAISQRQSADQAAAALFVERELPQFKEYFRFYRMLKWSYQIDGADRIDHSWYRQKPDRRVNPFTGLRWPPREL